MTDPNPLKQAAEEAKARKLAEVAAHQDAQRVIEAREDETVFLETAHFNRELIPASFEIVRTLEIVMPQSGSIQAILRRNNIETDAVTQSLFTDMLQMQDADMAGMRAKIAIITPGPEFVGDRTPSNLRERLAPFANFPSISVLAEVAGSFTPPTGRKLVGLGAWIERAMTANPPRMIPEFPLLKADGNGYVAATVDGHVNFRSERILIPVVLATHSHIPASSVAP
jgi:hypothetical protein